MNIQIYNTLSRKKEPFETLAAGEVRMYVCGPTVYDKAHIGHAMSVLVFDIIRRYLQYRGLDVLYVMNFTDVDDKIIQRANELGVDPFNLAEIHIQEFSQHLDDLNVLPATVYPRATREIDNIIEMISGLEDKGYAYSSDGDVYFRVQKDEDYGRLSGRRLEDMRAGARIEVGLGKEHPMDFTLWKAAKEGEPAWDSPWGKGRPGWHIECSAMNLAHLGKQIDIHGGGNDLVFPHHENEIAQTESLTGEQFARYWVHNGMLQMSGEKMSKSLGNIISIEDFLANHDPDALRMMVLNANYRHPLTYNDDVVSQAERALNRLRSALKPAPPSDSESSLPPDTALEQQIRETKNGFFKAMDDDFNSARALGHMFDLVRTINQSRNAGTDRNTVQEAQRLLKELSAVFGLRLEKAAAETSTADAFIDLLIELRSELREQKDWALSDKIRDRLMELGITLEDGRSGTTWHWSSDS
jgi:cysteinyl-tRNA synthetase